jgi:3-methyladenine DNA glycosylase AlkD
MPPKSKRTSAHSAKKTAPPSLHLEVESVVATLKGLATKHTLDGMARYAIPSDKAFGVAVGDIRKLAKRLGRNHELAGALWDTGWYEARMLACFLDDPEQVTADQMDRWCHDFDSWAICDTACFHLFDRTQFAWKKPRQWAKSPHEFVKRAAFALMASLAGHDKTTADGPFAVFLPLIEKGARDERNFVKKGVNWALRRIGERSLALNKAAVALAERLAQSEIASCRWVGKDALRQLANPKVRARLARRSRYVPL